MANPPTEDQIERGKKIGNWIAGFSFWMIVAPPCFLAISRMTSIPLSIFMVALGVSEETMNTMNLIFGWLGFASGVGFTWWVWTRVKQSYLNHAA